jgi:beta-phosphoglucomutase-like phosphatase (HAD superfamily)
VVPGPCVVVDLDGTLSDASGRQHFLEQQPKDWKRFFAAVGDDPVLAHVARLLECLDPELQVVLLTARPVSTSEATTAWLARFDVGWDLLVMRDVNDYRPSPEAKQDAVRALVGVGFDIRLAIDDDPRNVAMFEAEGIPTLFVSSGYYPPR